MEQSLILDAFRIKYLALESRVGDTVRTSTGDAVLLQKLGDELDEYYRNLSQVWKAASQAKYCC